MITQAQLKEYLDYNSDTGVFTWKKKTSNASRINIGDVAGYPAGRGYWNITIFDKQYFAHRLAWIYVNGDIDDGLQIDHINRDRKDNRIENLRLATPSQNKRNSKKRNDNTTGYIGVSFHKGTQRYTSRIVYNKKRHTLGYFATPEEAYDAYCKASKQYHKEYSAI